MTLRDYLEMVLPATEMLLVTQEDVHEYVDYYNYNYGDGKPSSIWNSLDVKHFKIKFKYNDWYFDLDQEIKKSIRGDIIIKGKEQGAELKQFIITFMQFQPIVVNI